MPEPRLRQSGSGTSVNPFELGDVFDVPNRRWDPVESAVPDPPILAPASYVVCCLFVIFAAVKLHWSDRRHIARRQRQHNSGFGSQESANASLRPWHTYMHGYVCGFRGRSALGRKGIERGLRRIGDRSVIIFTVQLAVPWRLSRLESLWCESTMTPSVGIVSDL